VPTRTRTNNDRLVRHLDAIEHLFDQMDAAKLRTDIYRRHYPKWVTLTLHHPHDWQQKDDQKHKDVHALENLEIFADRLDGIAPMVTPGGLESIRQYAASASALVDEDESLDPLLKQQGGCPGLRGI
jgi:hypothetical protein